MDTSLIMKASSNSISHSPIFLTHNGFTSSVPQVENISEIYSSDVEMISLQSVTYTSLRDLLPASPPTIMSPIHNSSWHEIPIKNPLVKQAALAYLQPMSSPPEVGDKGIFGIIRDKCGCGDGVGCLAWLRDIVFKLCGDGDGNEEDEDEDEDDDDEEDDDYYVKVD